MWQNLQYKYQVIVVQLQLNNQNKVTNQLQQIYSMTSCNLRQFFDSEPTSELNHESMSYKQRINSLWTKEENLIYIAFLKQHRDIFTTEEIRRHNKVFIMLAKLLPSRSSDQCRSHHQKMVISHKSIDRIIKHLEKKMTKTLIKKQKRQAKIEQQSPRETQAQSLSETVLQSTLEITQSQISNQQFNEEDLWNVLV